MAAAKAARRNTTVHMHDFYLPNDPFQDPYVGRRTGVPLNIRARKDSNGFDNIDDYFPDSEPEEENIVPNEQNSDRDLLVGRRTGIPLNINPRKDSNGFESVDDYFPDSVHDDQVEDIPEGASENPDEQEAPETPEEQVESPNETGTIIKNPASREPTPRINGPIKKRLSFAHGKSPTELEPSNQAQPRILQNGTKSITEEEDESDSEIIDVVDVDDDSQPDHQESCNVQPSNAFKDEEKGGNQKATTTKQKKNQRTMSIEDDEIIDVDGIDDEEETFLTIGNTTRNANKSIAVVKSPISAEAESFVMSESFVLEGTKHKTMSPEYGSCSDSQPEPSDLQAPREKKSKIPVRKKGVSIGTKQKVTRGRKKKMEDLQGLEQGAENVETEDGGDERLLDSKQEETTSETLRGRTQINKRRSASGRQKKVEVDEMQNKAPKVAEDLDNKSNENEGDVEVEEENKFLKEKTQNTNRRSMRGRHKSVEDSQNVEPEADETENLENDYVEVDVEVGEGLSNSNEDQKQSLGEEELVDSEVVEARVGEVEKKGKLRAKSLPVSTKQQPQRSTRKVKKSDENAVVMASDEELLRGGKKDDSENDQVEKRGRGRKGVPNTRQQEMKVSRGRKQKSEESLEHDDGDSEDGNGGERPTGPKARRRQQEKKVEKGRKQGSEENFESEVDDGDNEVVGPDDGKAGGLTRKGAESKKMRRQGKSDAEVGTEDEDGAAKLSGRKTIAQRKKEAKQNEDDNGEERQGDVEGNVEDGSADVELSGRKARGQRKKEAEAKLNREDGEGEERGEETQEAIVDFETEDAVHSDREEMALENTGKGEEDSNHNVLVEGVKAQELDTVVQREGRAGKAKDNNELENDGKFGEVANKRRGRKSLRDQKTGLSEGQSLIEEAEVLFKARTRKKGKGKETTKVSPDGGQKDVLDIVGELDEEQKSSNKTLHESVSNSSSVSSIVSSGSESKKKAGSKRRKHSSLLPPYARRGHKSKNLKISATVNSQDSTTESELRTDAKKPRLEEEREKSIIAGETSKKGGAIGSGKGGRAVRTARTSAGGKKPVAQRKKTKKSEVTHDKSVSSAAQNNDEDDHADVFRDSDELNGEGDGNFSVQEAGGVEDRSFEEVPSEGITPTPFLKPAAKSATALKSILKYGGSVGRANTAGRKRQMSADKSHSGGSDADDESVLPAKQANRKRLSTVSFASSPFVHASPADRTPSAASRRSPLSFLSHGSNGSSDLSFNPGSGRTVRSSVGTASSVSGAGDSDIDPDEEVTLTNDDGQQEGSTDEQSTRRSKRTIVPPLQFWKNERIDYERRQSGGWAIKGVLRNPTPTPKTKKKSKPKRPIARKQNHVDAEDSSEEELGNEDFEGFQEIANPTCTVFNPETKEEVKMDLFHAPGMLHFTNPSGNPATDDDPLIVHKFISQPLFGGGQVILRPGTEKGRQFVRNDTMVFYVIKGKIMVTIHQSSVVLNTGSSFFVPQGNSYNIKNLKQTDAKLMFVQIKG